MSKVARLSAVALIVLTTQALAEAQVYPVGGLGDAWMQNQPSSVGITNGYDPRVQTYLVPGNPPYRVPANTRFQGRAAMAG
jgi:hypothetical protein